MSAFRDAIAVACARYDTAAEPRSMSEWQDNADDVLAMPEMQALKGALAGLDSAGGPNYLSVMLEIPDSVIAWVRS